MLNISLKQKGGGSAREGHGEWLGEIEGEQTIIWRDYVRRKYIFNISGENVILAKVW